MIILNYEMFFLKVGNLTSLKALSYHELSVSRFFNL